MARRIAPRLISALLLALGLVLASAAGAQAQEGTPEGCGTPAVPADPGAPGDGATPAQPAQPAPCPEDSAVTGAGNASVQGSGAAQAGPDGVLGTADDILPTSASTGFGGAAGDPSTRTASTLLAAGGLALMASMGVRRMARARR